MLGVFVCLTAQGWSSQTILGLVCKILSSLIVLSTVSELYYICIWLFIVAGKYAKNNLLFEWNILTVLQESIFLRHQCIFSTIQYATLPLCLNQEHTRLCWMEGGSGCNVNNIDLL